MSENSVPVPILEVLEACAGMIRAAGFHLEHVSSVSEARYFVWPGRRPMLRLATHSRKRPPQGLPPIVSKLTIGNRHDDPYDHVTIDPQKIPGMVAAAIGRYMMASAPGWRADGSQKSFTVGLAVVASTDRISAT